MIASRVAVFRSGNRMMLSLLRRSMFERQRLKYENRKLRAEVERLRSTNRAVALALPDTFQALQSMGADLSREAYELEHGP